MTVLPARHFMLSLVHKHSSFPHKNIKICLRSKSYKLLLLNPPPTSSISDEQTTNHGCLCHCCLARSFKLRKSELNNSSSKQISSTRFSVKRKKTANFHQTHSMSWKAHSLCAGKQISIFRGFSSLCVSICRFVHIENVSFCIFKQFCLLLPRLSRFLATEKFIHGFIVSPYCSAFRNAFFMNENWKIDNFQLFFLPAKFSSEK